MNLTRLQAAQTELRQRMVTLPKELGRARLDLGNAIVFEILGDITPEEVDEARRRVIECSQAIEGFEGAEKILENMISEAGTEARFTQLLYDAQRDLTNYFEARKHLLDNPQSYYTNPLLSLANRCDSHVEHGRFGRPLITFTNEASGILKAIEKIGPAFVDQKTLSPFIQIEEVSHGRT